MRILIFLLNTLFFFLVAAALLRGLMNTLRMRMTQQPGIFLMAITDWVVQPVRKILPRAWGQANSDWGSFLSAGLLALAYAFILLLLQGGALTAVPLVAAIFTLRTALQALMVLALVYAILSWVQPHAHIQWVLSRLISPLLAPIRRIIPTIGGVDLSVLVLIILLQVGLILIG